LEKDTFCKENEREREKKVYQILIWKILEMCSYTLSTNIGP
jgi:hypothetical protein